MLLQQLLIRFFLASYSARKIPIAHDSCLPPQCLHSLRYRNTLSPCTIYSINLIWYIIIIIIIIIIIKLINEQQITPTSIYNRADKEWIQKGPVSLPEDNLFYWTSWLNDSMYRWVTHGEMRNQLETRECRVEWAQ